MNHIVAVFVTRYGTDSNYDNQAHVYDWSLTNGVLTVRFVGDNDKYMGVNVGVVYTD